MPYASTAALSAGSDFNGQPHRRIEPSPGRATILLALGIVYGDLGTSPLYTLQTIVHLMGRAFDADAALGSLSLVFWSLIVTISIKYSLLVMRADNYGEGGILALMAMTGARWSGRGRSLLIAGLFGAALIYGDGIITPAISVLSAVEGVNVATAIFKPYTMPIAVLILLGLFTLQTHGTASVGKAFGPIMLLWFITIGGLGVFGLFSHPEVLAALDPSCGLRLLTTHGFAGFAVLGGVFLAVTGGEALYADMGHVGRAPIRVAWYCIVLPALILNYAGQVAAFIASPDLDSNPFFKLAPSVALYPLVALATLATIIASQAIITGCFSMTRQAMQLGWFPGIRIRQTSADEYGQIYVPFVNWTMMLMTIALTATFGTSDRLAGAYGTAVSTTMVLTTILLFEVTCRRWHWPLWQSVAIAVVLLGVDLSFFAANLLKLLEGGWIPLTFGLLVFIVMITGHSGITTLHKRNAKYSETAAAFLGRLTAEDIVRVPGTGIFLTRFGKGMPPIIVNYVTQTRSLFETVVALSVSFESTPRVWPADRIKCEKLGKGLWHMTVHFGFVEIPDLPSAISAARREGLPAWDRPTFYIERYDAVSRSKRPWLSRWRVALFAFMSRNSAHAVDRFRIPSKELVEIGRRIQL
ncbi:potassium transporter Kup [Bradyrhizobium stylosanthis]|uniref:Probable potassium transport system protein Kup n=1 Tax=Bradyrhizobium stylosanthis TaxID=1803665 RepID=A0A560DFG0_9BRAD|nr:KUP/HAK/KT family potassium transporter [Bradyrhizobium stylosanthis]TWA95837.1 KUP system potassium uptake protein [Bradyrhizobium stylosanthis]